VNFDTLTFAILLEYCPSGDVFTYTFDKVTVSNLGMCNTIFTQILEGITYMHSKRISHCDIKLENIVLNGNFQAKLIDYGFCEIGGHMIKYKKGTNGYYAPE